MIIHTDHYNLGLWGNRIDITVETSMKPENILKALQGEPIRSTDDDEEEEYEDDDGFEDDDECEESEMSEESKRSSSFV